jgi:hypothetical protein
VRPSRIEVWQAEPPDWDPVTRGRWANVVAAVGPGEKAKRVAYQRERARRGLWWQRMIELADARRYAPAVVDRATRT